jgi:hypothetical protein
MDTIIQQKRPQVNIGISSNVGFHDHNNFEDVAFIQNKLKERGYIIIKSGLINHKFNDPTILAIKNFQQNASLPITGVIEPQSEAMAYLLNPSVIDQKFTEEFDESLHLPKAINAFNFRRNANNRNTLNVIFEGDSWLDYPIPRVLDLYDTISQHNQRFNLNALHLAKFGETTTDMFRDRNEMIRHLRDYRVDRIFFSGGGNDVFPQLQRMLKPGKTNFLSNYFTDQSKLNELLSTPSGDQLYDKCIRYKNYLNTSLFDAELFNTLEVSRIFSTIKQNYMSFGTIFNHFNRGGLVVYLHTYDYPLFKLGVRPSAGITLPIGPWIQPVFNRLGIVNDILKAYIIIRLLDKFHSLLREIQADYRHFGFRFTCNLIDFRGLLRGSQYWRDEIHPNSAGARRLATRVNF